jgi:ssRNA-specific RNase YbeY (16S rRNA maturation enzyme)
MDITLFNEFLLSNIDISINSVLSLIQKEFSKAKLPKKINLIFVDEEEITSLNERYRGKEEVTDVLSFEVDDDIAEIYICIH